MDRILLPRTERKKAIFEQDEASSIVGAGGKMAFAPWSLDSLPHGAGLGAVGWGKDLALPGL